MRYDRILWSTALRHWWQLGLSRRCSGVQIVSGSRDKTVKLWNTLGECKYTIGEPDGHTEWVSCVRFSPVTTNPIIVSAGWDKLVKVCLFCDTYCCASCVSTEPQGWFWQCSAFLFLNGPLWDSSGHGIF